VRVEKKIKFKRVVLASAPSTWKDFHISPPLPSVTPTMGYLTKYIFNVPTEVTENFRKLDGSTHTEWGMAWEAAWNTADGASEETVNSLAVFAGGRHTKNFVDPPKSEHLGTDKARREYICHNLNLMRPEDLEYIFTAESFEKDVFMDWPKDPLVKGGYSCPKVGEVLEVGPVIHRPVHGRIHLAGEYACRYKWCGFMEGALISGAGVAKEILKHTQQ